MDMSENQLTEEMLSQFYELKQQKKHIDEEISRLRKEILTYFNDTKGEEVDVKIEMGQYVIQRSIRKQQKYDREKTVEKLKMLGLEECVLTVEQPDEDKIQSALSLKFITTEDLDGCIQYKVTPYLTVEKFS